MNICFEFSWIYPKELICWVIWLTLGFSSGTVVKNLPANAGDSRDVGLIPRVRKIPVEKEMATCSTILAWRIPWTVEPGGLQSMGSQRVECD